MPNGLRITGITASHSLQEKIQPAKSKEPPSIERWLICAACSILQSSASTSEPVPLTGLAHDVLLSWKKEQGNKSPFLFPSPVKPGQPITTVKTAWKTTLKNAGVAHFPIYHLRHVFCTRLSWVAPDAV